MTEFEINRDPFSLSYGRREAVLPSCSKCDRRVGNGASTHRSCCDHPSQMRGTWAGLTITLARNGQRLYFLPCSKCLGNAPVKTTEVPPALREVTPTSDYTDVRHPCGRCDNPLTEYHHWAPQAIFADADYWPGAWLCKACHTTWHQAMRESAGVSLSSKRFCDWANDEGRLSRIFGDHWGAA